MSTSWTQCMSPGIPLSCHWLSSWNVLRILWSVKSSRTSNRLPVSMATSSLRSAELAADSVLAATRSSVVTVMLMSQIEDWWRKTCVWGLRDWMLNTHSTLSWPTTFDTTSVEVCWLTGMKELLSDESISQSDSEPSCSGATYSKRWRARHHINRLHFFQFC